MPAKRVEAEAKPGRPARILSSFDRIIPDELLSHHETRLRSRVLVLCSITVSFALLNSLIVRMMTFAVDTNAIIGVGIFAVVGILPLIQYKTRSSRIASGLLSGVLCLSLPTIQLNFGSFPAPVLAFLPFVPVLVTFFGGALAGLVCIIILTASTLLTYFLLPTDLTVFYRALPSYAAFSVTSPVLCYLLAAIYDRNRLDNEASLDHINQDLALARARAEAADRRKTEFLRAMSHELRTPLNAIIGYTELLTEELADSPNSQLAGDAANIETASRHLLALINELLDISKIEAGAVDFAYEDLDVAEFCHALETTLSPLATRNDNRLVVTADPGIATIVTDRQRLQQVLLNLAGNACKFTEHGTITVSVTSARPGWFCVTVADTGIGMAPEDLTRLFEAFIQVDRSADRRREGTGLGLMISKRLVEAMGGEIDVTSTCGVGTTFTVELPSDPALLSTRTVVVQATRAAREASDPNPMPQ